VLPFTYTTIVISGLVKFLLPKVDSDFIIYKYLPRLGLATRNIQLTADEQSDIVHKAGGVLMKILYAFVW